MTYRITYTNYADIYRHVTVSADSMESAICVMKKMVVGHGGVYVSMVDDVEARGIIGVMDFEIRRECGVPATIKERAPRKKRAKRTTAEAMRGVIAL